MTNKTKSFAEIGLIALIDEATGYQKERFKNNKTELRDMLREEDRKKIEKFAEELLAEKEGDK